MIGFHIGNYKVKNKKCQYFQKKSLYRVILHCFEVLNSKKTYAIIIAQRGGRDIFSNRKIQTVKEYFVRGTPFLVCDEKVP